MASSPGTTSSGSLSLLQNSGSEENLQQLMDQRKRKRMVSNRESARRSRMRKQKHLDDLSAELTRLRTESSQLIANVSVTTQNYLNFESENSILRAQVAELTNRLQSLNEIISFLDASNAPFPGAEEPIYNIATEPAADLFMNMNNYNSMDYLYGIQRQPIMASADMLQY